ncbi:uncharacterized protein LOC122371831 [Amphibalanus amphitrite]|uniref:uncharacterized protein LOC122371831 n=1 Tax=Amphibalanus amphitrite TaxID=1232801 RepID=UPI001C91E357|nr:uncharacterized protein LOC122371831 [Amphibalanus amphitrite]XP_043204497.1 uncharacterized protein LOC122371831 [Amphibalanus amphitrite]
MHHRTEGQTRWRCRSLSPPPLSPLLPRSSPLMMLPLMLLMVLLMVMSVALPAAQAAAVPNIQTEGTTAPGLWLRSPDITPPAAASSTDFRTERYHISELFEQL